MATRQNSDLKLDDFEAWARRVRSLTNKASTTGPPRSTPSGTLLRVTYRYYRRLKKAGMLEDLRAYLEERDPGRWHRHVGDGVDWVLRLLETTPKPFLTAPRRARLANALRLADKLDISSKWMLPFVLEAGGETEIAALLRGTEVPKWAQKYVEASSET